MLRIELRAAANAKPGHGELTIHGWKNDPRGEFELSVQRNQDDCYLGEFNDWIASAVWHLLGEPDRKENALHAQVGPWFVDPLIEKPHMVYQLQLRNQHGADFGVLRIVGTLLSSQAEVKQKEEEKPISSRFTAEPEEEPFDPNPFRAEAEVEPEPFDPNPFIAEPEPDAFAANPFVTEEKPKLFSSEPELIGPPPPVAPPPRPPLTKNGHTHNGTSSKLKKKGHSKDSKKSAGPVVVIVLLLLALAGAAIWWFFLRKGADENFVTGSSPQVQVASSCNKQALANTSDDLAFIRTCLNTQPSSQQVLATIANAKQAGRCNLVQRLYAYKAQAGDVTVALAYAGEYDPKSFSGGCIEAADAETAAYWYEIVLEHDPQNGPAQQRLAELKP